MCVHPGGGRGQSTAETTPRKVQNPRKLLLPADRGPMKPRGQTTAETTEGRTISRAQVILSLKSGGEILKSHPLEVTCKRPGNTERGGCHEIEMHLYQQSREGKIEIPPPGGYV